MISYWQKSSSTLIKYMIDHLVLSITAVSISLIVSVLIVYILLYQKKTLKFVSDVFSTIYSIPSLAMFGLLIPFLGLGKNLAIVVLVIYSLYIFFKNFIAGFEEIDEMYIESAFGLGMTKGQVFKKVQLPMAIQTIMSSIRIASTSTIGLATIGATVNAGGLGVLLFDGLRTMNLIKLLWGILLIALLCLLINVIIMMIENILIKYMVRSV